MADEKGPEPMTVPSEVAPFTVFTLLQKRGIVFLTALAGVFSPLSSFIFYPAITPIASDLHVSIGLVNLAITTYMIVSGVVPAVLGNAADKLGRRPIYIFALSVYFIANIGLAVQNSYAALFVLRMVQSAGSSGTLSLGYGIISDISTPSERGSYVGIFSLGPNVAPPLGPVIGGVLAAKLGWRSIFWFLVIFGGLCLLTVIAILPETARSIVGNGSNPATGVHRTLLPICLSKHETANIPSPLPKEGRLSSLPNPLACLRILLERDMFILQICYGLFYTTYSCIQASLSTLFMEIYGIQELQGGLIYIPFGLGCLSSVYIWGKVLDLEYAKIAKRRGFDIAEVKTQRLDEFPIEVARLRSVFYLVVATTAGMIAYGWAVQARVHVAGPLVIQAILGFTISAAFVAFGTLITDLNPDRSSTAAASVNIVRCLLAAAGTAALQPIIDGVGPGWCFTIFGGLIGVCGPLLLLEIRIGPTWRKQRMQTSA
ncbi:major facilitator superfamily transporter [Xylariaceae sp. FL1019]|nr:major facilitator superfamily transporter [Xylariaceae sp. FL1019]